MASQSERSIHDMLRDTPAMNDASGAIHSGAHEPHSGRSSVAAMAASSKQQQQHPNSLALHSAASAPPTPTAPHAGGAFATSPTAMMMNGSSSSGGLQHIGGMGDSTSSAASSSSTAFLRNSATRIDSIRNWSISTYKCTRQLMLEKLGKSQRTVDSELEAQIEQLRETQRKYLQVLRLARALHSHFQHVVQTQLCLAEAFGDLAQKSPELQEEFTYNAEAQRSLTKNGELLLQALGFFASAVATLCNKTMEDTLITVRQYETARVEFDAYRMDLENARPTMMMGGSGGGMGGGGAVQAVATAQATTMSVPGSGGEEAQRSFAKHRDSYEKLRADIGVKMQFLDENRIKVMHKQLVLLHNAVSAYFSGNAVALESTLKQFNIKLKSPNAVTGSWLEQ